MENKPTKDPVCGAELEPKEVKATAVYNGKTYNFCEFGCKAKFDGDPEKYTKTSGTNCTQSKKDNGSKKTGCCSR